MEFLSEQLDGETGRWHCFSREEIAKRGNNLDISWLRDESLVIRDGLPSPVEIESRDRFEAVYGKDLNLKLFIRKLVGLDRNAAKQAFAMYLESGNFSANQIHFVENIIGYLTQNGVMDPGLLYEPPFTDSHPEGLDGVFRDDNADQIVSLVHSFNNGRVWGSVIVNLSR